MLTIQVNPNYYDLSFNTVLENLSFVEKQFIKADKIEHVINDKLTFIEYNKSSLTYIPPYFRRVVLKEDKSILWD